MKKVITISGKPGVGKTTMAEILSSKLNYDILSSGDVFRKIASELNLSILEFVENYLPKHSEIDLKIDSEFVEKIKNSENLIVPTRVISYLLEKNNIKTFNVYLYADFDERLARIYKREDGDIEILRSELQRREEAEFENFQKLYNIDINDLTMYNLVIYTHFMSSKPGYIKIRFNNKDEYIKADNTLPETISGIIIEKYKELITNH